jgi:hypothetical protein
MGRIKGPYMESGKVLTQMKDATGAAVMEDESKYPHAAAMIHPIRRPMTTARDFMIGEPKRSQMIIVMNTEKPNPINSAEPQGSGWGAAFEGQS